MPLLTHRLKNTEKAEGEMEVVKILMSIQHSAARVSVHRGLCIALVKGGRNGT